jgi:dihydroneopterin aldolase
VTDTVYCNGLRLAVRIGFHEFERRIHQAVKVDLAMETDFRTGPSRDQHTGLVDYYLVTRHLIGHVKDRSYDLIEALAEDMARQVFAVAPQVGRVKVRITKNPLDMPEVESVGVECVRTPADLVAVRP